MASLDFMRLLPCLFTLTVLNFGLLLWQYVHPKRTSADEIAPVLRGRELQLVDTRGRVRAEIKVLPADATVKMPDGTTGYPETVLLRLITSDGSPNVKIAATEDGSGVSLGANSRTAHVQILSRGERPLLKIVNGSGKQQTIQP